MGQFRGLAFANFRVAADADAVVAALNGFDVQGRKLRVEYKKVLQAGEKERIEREKAIRRMRSMQLEKEQQMLGAGGPVGSPYDEGYSPLHAPIMSQSRSFSGALPMVAMPGMPVPQPYIHPTQPPLVSSMTTPNLSTHKTTSAAQTELDLNDSATLEIYSRVLLFRDDPMRDELAFSRSLNPKQRRIVHLVAQKLGVYHYSVGEGDERYAVVTRREPNRNPETPGASTSERIGPIRHHSTQALNRSFLSPTSASSANLFSSSTSTSSVYHKASTTANSSALRTKNSMPDIKSLYTPQPRLTTRASNGNIREGYATFSSPIRRAPSSGAPTVSQVFGGTSGIPPVPELGLGAEGGSGSGTNTPGGTSGNVVRQPRGPGVGGFLRRRESGVGPTDMGRTISSMGGLNATTHEPLEI